MMSLPSWTDEAGAGAFRVRSPNAGDAIGSALRVAFADLPAAPDDMLGTLRRLDATDAALRRR